MLDNLEDHEIESQADELEMLGGSTKTKGAMDFKLNTE